MLWFILTQAKKIEEAAEGWEYAPLFNLKFHATERTMDMVRRRRWHRKMVCEKKGADCFFAMKFEVFIFYHVTKVTDFSVLSTHFLHKPV
jgi:hypothetical protein